MIVSAGYPTLLHRHAHNPILTAADWPYPVHAVFNPGAVRLIDGTTLLLCRAEDRRGMSHLCAVRSANGVDGWTIDPVPTLAPDPAGHVEELWGIEDPRITYVDELEQYAVVYTAFSSSGPGVAIALTRDFVTFERLGLVMQPDDKDAALLPRRINGHFALIHRPIAPTGAHIWMSTSPDLRSWGNHTPVLQARKGGWWDANKIGLSPPLIETSRGWLMLYHGVRHTAAGALYRLGLALFHAQEPNRCLLATSGSSVQGRRTSAKAMSATWRFPAGPPSGRMETRSTCTTELLTRASRSQPGALPDCLTGSMCTGRSGGPSPPFASDVASLESRSATRSTSRGSSWVSATRSVRLLPANDRLSADRRRGVTAPY